MAFRHVALDALLKIGVPDGHTGHALSFVGVERGAEQMREAGIEHRGELGKGFVDKGGYSS